MTPRPTNSRRRLERLLVVAGQDLVRSTKDVRRRLEYLEDKSVLELASQYCSFSPGNIVAIGQILAVPEISGYKRLVKGRDDIEFIVNDSGLEAILRLNETELEKHSHPESEAEWYSIQKDGRIIVFWHDVITFQRGEHASSYRIPEKVFYQSVRRETTGGVIYVAPVEFDTALKIRKNRYENFYKMNPENALNAASAIIGMELSGRDFDHRDFADYLVGGISSFKKECACEACGHVNYLVEGISFNYGRGLQTYLDQIRNIAVKNLPKKNSKPLLLDALARSEECFKDDYNLAFVKLVAR